MSSRFKEDLEQREEEEQKSGNDSFVFSSDEEEQRPQIDSADDSKTIRSAAQNGEGNAYFRSIETLQRMSQLGGP
jgi:hypothetical protein